MCIRDRYNRANAEAMASEIKTRLSKEHITVGATFFQEPDEHWGGQMLDGVILVMEILAVVSLFMSVVLVTNTMTAIITEQTNQIGIIKAIGGRQHEIIRLYLSGVLLYGILALTISLPLGATIAYGGSRQFRGKTGSLSLQYVFVPVGVYPDFVALRQLALPIGVTATDIVVDERQGLLETFSKLYFGRLKP